MFVYSDAWRNECARVDEEAVPVNARSIFNDSHCFIICEYKQHPLGSLSAVSTRLAQHCPLALQLGAGE